MIEPTKTTTALVLGGGAAWGAWSVGALCMLGRMFPEWRPPIITGTSLGAVIGRIMAEHETVKAGAKAAKRLWLNEVHSSRDLFRIRPLQGCLASPEPLRDLLKKHTRLERLKIPFRSTAVDLNDGLVYHLGGSVDDIMASAAIPGVFPPVRRGSRLFTDGGVLDSLPMRACWPCPDGRITRVIVVTPRAMELPPWDPGRKVRAAEVLQRVMAIRTLDRLKDDLGDIGNSLPVGVISPLVDLGGALDFSLATARNRMQQGRVAVERLYASTNS